MEEDIKILEESIDKMIKDERIHDDYRNTITAIENLIKGYRELKEITNKYDAFANDYMPNDVKMVIADRKFFQDGIFNESFIPKSKIKEFVEENKWNLSETEYHFDSTVVDADELLKFMEDK